jgi:hypothetical protein
METYASDHPGGMDRFNAQDCQNSLDLTGANDLPAGIEQLVPTVIGQQYALSFYLCAASGS